MLTRGFQYRKRKEFNSAAMRAPDELKELQRPQRGGRAGARAGAGSAAASRPSAAAAASASAGGGSDAIKAGKKAKWKMEHEQFMSAMRAARQMRAYEASGDPTLLPPPPAPAENADYVQVPT